MKLGRSRIARVTGVLGGGGGGIRYLFRDLFSTDRAAGAVNGTAAEPGPGTRMVIDTASKEVIASGLLAFTAGKNTLGDPGYWLDAVARTQGRVMTALKRPLVSGTSLEVGWDTTQSGDLNTHTLYFVTSPAIRYDNTVIGSLDNFSAVQVVIVLRTSGAFVFTKIIGDSTWRLWYYSVVGTATPLYPGITTYTAIASFDFLSVPQDLYTPQAVVSDSFNRATLGSVTDGAGCVEGGGAGVALVSQLGTWKTNSSTWLQPNVLSGGVGILTTDCGVTDYLVSAKIRKNAGTLGLVLRYVDANNYIYVYALNDGAEKISVRKVVAGVDSEVLASTANGSGSFDVHLLAQVSGTKIRIFLYDNAIGTELTVDDAALQASTLCGIYSTNTNTLVDSFVVYPQNGYSGLDKYFGNYKTILPFGDSKTAATSNLAWTGYPPQMTIQNSNIIEYPTRIAAGGTTVRTWAAAIDASLAASVGTPEHILCNLGVNDTRVEPRDFGPTFDWTTWVTNYLYIIDAFHTKWPLAKIYIMRPWCATADVATRPVDFAEMDNVQIPAIVAARSTFVFVGPDERVFLENGDNGATNTSDGVHPNVAGNALTAQQWRANIGL